MINSTKEWDWMDKMNYLFDIDGTLTPSRLKIDPKFEKFFLNWMKDKNVYLVTGSDKDKTVEQIGEKIWNSANRAYQSCGNAVYEGGELIRKNSFTLPPALAELLESCMAWSEWPTLYGTHIEERIGLVNFSTIGRGCPQEARDRYAIWDAKTRERETFCQLIEDKFPDLEASVGGQISIDIHIKGQNKAQVLEEIGGPITFFGDKCKPGGNDYPIVQNLKEYGVYHEVKDWKETWEILNGR